MRWRWIGEDHAKRLYVLECPNCGRRTQVSPMVVAPPSYDVGEAKPTVRCWECRQEPHVPGPRDRALDEGRRDPGVREEPMGALARGVATAIANRRRREEHERRVADEARWYVDAAAGAWYREQGDR